MAKTMYEITKDLVALDNLLEGMVDENGEPREPTPEETEQMKAWFDESAEQFERKFDSYCKFIKNLRISAAAAEGERKAHADEMKRLSKRASAYQNRADAVQGLLRWNMERLHMDSCKTTLFSARIQNTQISVKALDGADLSEVPEEYLKPREINASAVKDAIKDKVLVQKDTPEAYSKLYFAKSGKELKNVRAVQGTALVIR